MATTTATKTKAKKATAPVVAETATVAKAEKPAQAEPRMFNPFANAPKLAPTAPPKKSGKVRSEVPISNMDKLSAFETLAEVLENEAGMVRAGVKDEVIEEYVDQMIDLGKKPDSFVGVGSISSASCEIRKRGSNMPISPETAQALSDRGIPIDKKVKVPARLVLNPEMSQENLMRLAELVAKDSVLSKEQVVFEQPEEFSFVTSDSTIDMIAKSGDREFIRGFVEQIAVFAIGKFKLGGQDITQTIKNDDGSKTKSVTPEAKRIAVDLLKKMGVL